MNPLIIPAHQTAECGHVRLVYYIWTEATPTAERKFQEHTVPCPLCRAVRMQAAIEEALIHAKGQCAHDQESYANGGKCYARIQEILEKAIA